MATKISELTLANVDNNEEIELFPDRKREGSGIRELRWRKEPTAL
jgi:hypothetical protein